MSSTDLLIGKEGHGFVEVDKHDNGVWLEIEGQERESAWLAPEDARKLAAMLIKHAKAAGTPDRP